MRSEYSNNLIISADDFGVSAVANRNILALAREGRIDRTGVMMGGKFSAEEVQELLHSGVKIDIHLHLLEKNFFNEREKEAHRGVFRRVFFFGMGILSGRYSTRKVKAIWKKQIEDFHEIFGKYPDGLNSHEHMHFFPPFFSATLALKEKFNVPFIRLGRKENKIGLKFSLAGFILMILCKTNHIFVVKSKRAKNNIDRLNTSDFLISFDWVDDHEKLFQNLPISDQTELVFHPERSEEMEFLQKNM